MRQYPEGLLKVVFAVALRPWLWRSVLRFVPSLRHPVPPPEFVRFRMQTMYGGDGLRAADHFDLTKDMLGFLKWCRKFPKVR